MMLDKAEQEISNLPPSSEQLAQVLARLSTDQIRFVVARQEYATDKEAAVAIGVKPDTVYQWQHKGVPLAEAVRLMALDGVVVASTLRRRHLAKAMAVKVAGLDLDDDKLRQGVASEIIEWEMGRATQRQEVTGAEGQPLAVTIYLPDNGRDVRIDDTDQTAAGATGTLPGDLG